MDIQNENLICTDKNNSLNMDNPYIINVQDEISYDILKDTAWFNCLIILMVLLPPLIPILIIVLLYLEKNIEISKSEKSDELIVIKKKLWKMYQKN